MKKLITLCVFLLSFSQMGHAQAINMETLSCGEFIQKVSSMSKQENGRVMTSSFLGALYGYAAGISDTKIFNDNYMETTFKSIFSSCVKDKDAKVKGILISAYTDVNAW